MLMHNLPWLMVLALFVILRKYVLVVGIVSLLAGGLLLALLLWIQSRGNGNPHLLFIVLLLPGPALMSGFLFMMNWFKNRAVPGPLRPTSSPV